MENLKKLIADYNAIDTAQDLKKRGIIGAEHYNLYFIIRDLADNKSAYFIQENIKNYLLKMGAQVRPHGTGYTATI